MGKSSLLYHVYQTYPQALQAPDCFLVAYVSLQDARVRTLRGFLRVAGAELETARRTHPGSAGLPPWPDPCDDLGAFRQALQLYADAGLRRTVGPNLRACWSRLAYFVDRILRGASPSDLPAEMPTVLETIVNLRTARAIDVAVPRSILARADRVID